MSTRNLVLVVIGISLLCGCQSQNSVENPTATIKDVIIDQFDEAEGTISVSFGKHSELADRSTGKNPGK